MKLKVYSDGASRGNSGHAAIAYTILDEDGKVLRKHSRYVGVRTNNQAEYEALISALEAALELKDREAACHMDSELVVKQLNREYKVRDQKLKPLWWKIQELEKKFQEVTFTHVPRTDRHIQEVDRLANQTLDRVSNSL